MKALIYAFLLSVAVSGFQTVSSETYESVMNKMAGTLFELDLLLNANQSRKVISPKELEEISTSNYKTIFIKRGIRFCRFFLMTWTGGEVDLELPLNYFIYLNPDDNHCISSMQILKITYPPDIQVQP